MNGILPASIDLLYPGELKDFILSCITKERNRPCATELLNSHFLDINYESDTDNMPIKLIEDHI